MRGFAPGSSTGFRIWMHKDEARRPFIRVLHSIPGFFYLGVGPIRIWVDGRRFGIGAR